MYQNIFITITKYLHSLILANIQVKFSLGEQEVKSCTNDMEMS